jgi:hypothetical protein
MPRVLADGKTKFTILTTKPANPAAPTATELNAGIDLSDSVLASDFNWSATDSDKIAEKALSDQGNSNAIGASNYTTGITLWRYYATAGGVDATADTGYDALKEKGTTVWGYARESDKDASEAWEAADEIYLGGEVITDSPQRLDGTGFIKRRVPLEMQRGYDNIVVGAGA